MKGVMNNMIIVEKRFEIAPSASPDCRSILLRRNINNANTI